MKHNDTPFFEHKTERQFVDEEAEMVISVKEFEKCLREAEERSARKERRKIQREIKIGKFYRIAGILSCALIIFGLSCLYKYLASKFSNIDYGWFGVIVLGIWAMIKGCIEKDEKLRTCKAENEVLFQVAWRGYIEIFTYVTGHFFPAALLVLCIIFFGGGIAGKFNLFDRFAFGGSRLVAGVINYENEMNGERKVVEVAEEKISEVTLEVLENYEGDPEEITSMKINQSELNTILNLSDEECGTVFFLQGDYAVENWDDQDEINSKVLQMVDDARQAGYINKFDDYAPQKKKDEIDKASKDEVSAEQFSIVKRINTTRSDIYTAYPKKSIANLIANGNQRLALILTYNDGQQVTILYYYSQSIIWEIEFLRYSELANSTVKDHLTKMAKRYGDINLVCSKCEETKYAEKLQVAFENAANQY
ncbi:MAG: hypothetical protein HDR04_05790 [Lachnospiraceae bacterium]|nr:hypothetical protein [Lachnospiraceae bacterium]